MKNIVVIGGGFAGMWAALTAARETLLQSAAVRVTLVSRDEYLTVRPRLYEVFTEAMRAPLGPVVGPLGIELLQGEATTVDSAARRIGVRLADGATQWLDFDRLVLAAGSEQRPLDVPGATEFTQNLDTFAAARAFDQHLAKLLKQPPSPGQLTFVVVGAGFTGIELASEMRRHIETHSDAETARKARVILIERNPTVGTALGEAPTPFIKTALGQAGVEARPNTGIANISADAVILLDGARIECATVCITTGLRASPLGAQLNAPRDPQGRLVVDENLQVSGCPGIYAAGDLALARTDPDHFALMSCQHAVPMGKFAGYNVAHDLMGSALRPYSQPNYVTCIDLGVYGALFTLGWERTPEMSGADAKALKKTVNTVWIYPPTGSREVILAAADLDAPWPPVT